MFRMWGKIFKNNHLLTDYTYENSDCDTRTHKVFSGIDNMCHFFNIPKPIWLDKNVRDFKKFSRVKFRADNFVEEIDFDYFEIRILEED